MEPELKSYLEDRNADTILILKIESVPAIENLDAKLSVPGIDSVRIGTNDRCMEMGIPGQFDHPRVKDAYQKVIAACRAHGKHPGMGGVYNPPLMKKYIDMGVRLILSGSDFSFMMAGAQNQASAVRALL